MYRTSSPPLFDIPDFPTLRRVKPLPKRRRTSSSSAISPALLSQSPTNPYVSSTYHLPAHPPSQNLSQTQSQVISNSETTRSSTNDTLPLKPDWRSDLRRFPSELFYLPKQILSVAKVLSETGLVPREDEGGGGGADAESLPLPTEQKSQPSVAPDSPSIPATPPPPSNASTDDEGDPQASVRPTFFRQPLDREDSNGEEEADSEGTEGDLQERLFLRAETDRLLAHADSLSARMALQSYYRSMGFGVPEFGSNVGGTTSAFVPGAGSGMAHVATEHASTPPSTTMSNGGVANIAHGANLTTGNGYVVAGVGRGQTEEGDGDGRGADYSDYANQQGQGNTKKRKVPANVGGSPPHHHHHHLHHYSSHRGSFGTGALGYAEAGDLGGGERELGFGFGFGLDLGSGAGAAADDAGTVVGGVESDVFGPLPGSTWAYQYPQRQPLDGSAQQLPPRQFHRKAKLSPVTLAGLQRKELIRSRKKQLEAIMGTLPVGDTWALDHALSANFPPLLSSFSSTTSSPSNSPTTDSDHGLSLAVNSHGGATESNGNWEVGWGWSDGEGKEVRVRLSKRKKMRIARAARMGLGRLGRHPDAAPFPTGEFTLTCPSTSECFLQFSSVLRFRAIFVPGGCEHFY